MRQRPTTSALRSIGSAAMATILLGAMAALAGDDVPAYLTPPALGHGTLSRPPGKPTPAAQGSQVLHRSALPLTAAWRVDPTLSAACGRGRFKQRSDRHYIATVQQMVYGAALGGHRSLVDQAGLAEPGALYLFIGQGTANCRVLRSRRPGNGRRQS